MAGLKDFANCADRLPVAGLTIASKWSLARLEGDLYVLLVDTLLGLG